MEKDNNKTETPEVGLIGMSHKTAPVDLREQFAFSDEEITKDMNLLHEQGVEETVCVSTCNRVEIYFASTNVREAAEHIMKLLEEKSQLNRKKFEKLIYKKYSKDAISHAMMVSASLDSLVVGEDEILGQMKDAFRKSAKEKRTGQILNRLFHTAFKTAKKIRTETEIARNPLSVAYIATELAMKVFEDISKRKALLVGAGEMGELILKYLTKYNISEIFLANRSFHNAEKIAHEVNRDAHIIPLEDITGVAGKVDIIVSSVSVSEYIINAEMGREVTRDRGDQPLFMIDISIPRSLDPDLSKMDNIFVYNVDDLQTIADENLKNRLKEVELARQIIESDVDEFYLWYEGLVVVPAIVSIQDRFDDIRCRELAKYRKRKLKHLSDEDFKLIEDLTNQIMTKTMHNPIMFLRSFNAADDKEKKAMKENMKIIEDLFHIRA
jgi:glutamyl-tRNA reductase